MSLSRGNAWSEAGPPCLQSQRAGPDLGCYIVHVRLGLTCKGQSCPRRPESLPLPLSRHQHASCRPGVPASAALPVIAPAHCLNCTRPHQLRRRGPAVVLCQSGLRIRNFTGQHDAMCPTQVRRVSKVPVCPEEYDSACQCVQSSHAPVRARWHAHIERGLSQPCLGRQGHLTQGCLCRLAR